MNYCFYPRVKILHTFLISLALLLTACGGGGGDSSSGGGSESTYVGTYTGMQSWTLSSPGVPSRTGEEPLTVVVASNGDVVITDSEGTKFTGTLTGESLSATGQLEGITIPGANCPAATITYTGTVSGTTITGSLNGAYNCTVSTGATFKITISGTFTVALQPEASATALGFNGIKRSMFQDYLSEIVNR